jgi:hypothetical protein
LIGAAIPVVVLEGKSARQIGNDDLEIEEAGGTRIRATGINKRSNCDCDSPIRGNEESAR